MSKVYRVVAQDLVPSENQRNEWTKWLHDVGMYVEDEALPYPRARQHKYFSKKAAMKKAMWLRSWGYQVCIEEGEVTVWTLAKKQPKKPKE